MSAGHTGLARWHAFMGSGGDPGVLFDLLVDDVVFHSPVVHTPQVGKPVVMAYLIAAAQVLGNESFHYVRELVDGDEMMLEFVTELDGISINGIDIIRFNSEGKNQRFQSDGASLEGDQQGLGDDGRAASGGRRWCLVQHRKVDDHLAHFRIKSVRQIAIEHLAAGFDALSDHHPLHRPVRTGARGDAAVIKHRDSAVARVGHDGVHQSGNFGFLTLKQLEEVAAVEQQ
jgi:hypothetical protein